MGLFDFDDGKERGFLDEILEPDWDGDGKHTIGDDIIEYEIFREIMEIEDEDKDNHSLPPVGFDFKTENRSTVFNTDSSTRNFNVNPDPSPKKPENNESDSPSDGTVILVSLVVIILCIGAMAICLSTEGGYVGKIILIAAAIGISIAVLKGSGMMK